MNGYARTFLTVLYATCMVVSNIVTTKQVQVPMGLAVTAGVFVFPLTYALSDVFSECYGYRWSRATCWMAFAANLIAVLAFEVAIAMPSAVTWDGQAAFQTVLGNTPRILLASLASYVLGDLANDRVFRAMKGEGGAEGFCARAVASSVVGEVVDSAVFFPLAFVGVIPSGTLATIALTQTALKLACECVTLPFTRLVVRRASENASQSDSEPF